jgi:signal transduction histidine kinase
MQWWRERPAALRDAIGAIPLVVVYLLGQTPFADGTVPTGAVALILALVAGMTVRRRWPAVSYLLALAIVLGATTGLEYLVVASYSVVVYAERSRPVVVAGVSLLVTFAGFLRYWPVFVLDDVAGDLALIVGVTILPVVFGWSVRRARATAAELAERNLELERLREQEAQHAVQTERLRIARELHDVVAHHVSAMTVRARAGHHVAARDPQAATDALAFVAASGTSTLAAMGTFVGALRGTESDHGSEQLGPQPGLAGLAELVESFRGLGLVVDEEIQPLPDDLATALSLNVYRIVQEALTNVVRHGARRAGLAEGDDRRRPAPDRGGRQRPRPAAGPPAGSRPGRHGRAGRAAQRRCVARTEPGGGCRLVANLQIERVASTAETGDDAVATSDSRTRAVPS